MGPGERIRPDGHERGPCPPGTHRAIAGTRRVAQPGTAAPMAVGRAGHLGPSAATGQTRRMRVRLDISADPADYSFRHGVRVRFAETDAMGVLHHAAYVPFLEEARVEYLRDRGRPYPEIRAEGYDLAVLELVVQYRRSARFDEVVVVHTRVSSFRGASFQIDYLLTVDDEVCALAATVHGVVDPQGRATRAPQWMKDLLTSPTPPTSPPGAPTLVHHVTPTDTR